MDSKKLKKKVVETSINEDYDRLKNDTSSLNKKLEGLSKKALEFTESIKVWEKLDDESKTLAGLRINYAKDLLDKLKDQYRLSNVNISFSKPEELKDGYISDTIIVVSSDVSIQFSAITDEYLFGFVDSLLTQYPGYIQVKTFSVTKSKNITKDVLTQIAAGESPALVDGKIDFAWRGLKYKGPMAATEEIHEN